MHNILAKQKEILTRICLRNCRFFFTTSVCVIGGCGAGDQCTLHKCIHFKYTNQCGIYCAIHRLFNGVLHICSELMRDRFMH